MCKYLIFKRLWEKIGKIFLIYILISLTCTGGGLSPIGKPLKSKDAKAMDQPALERQDACPVDDDDDSSSDDSKSDDKDKNSDGDSGDAGGLSDDQKKNIKKGYEHLHDKYGVSAKLQAAMYGNFMQESHLNVKSVEGVTGEPSEKEMKAAEKRHEDYHTGLGLGQWSYERNDMLVDHAKKMKKDWWHIEVQLDFMVTADSAADKFKEIAEDAGDDIEKNVDSFHDTWEAGGNAAYVNGKDPSIKNRKEQAQKVWKYMKKEGLTGGKDKSKIKKIGGKGDTKDNNKGESSANDKGESVNEDPCEGKEKDDDNSGSSGTGKVGESTKKNGKSGKVIGSNYTYDKLPKKYKKYVKLPKFDTSKIGKDGQNPYEGDNTGQCTELTYYYMKQIWKKTQAHGDTTPEQDGNGDVIYKSYKTHGAKITDKPTVGYGFSAEAPAANAHSDPPGHTGVVVGVMPDGKYIIANFNVEPKLAPSRETLYSVIDGTDGKKVKFFSGVKGSKDPSKGDDKDDDKDKKDK